MQAGTHDIGPSPVPPECVRHSILHAITMPLSYPEAVSIQVHILASLLHPSPGLLVSVVPYRRNLSCVHRTLKALCFLQRLPVFICQPTTTRL